jgi:hypothetical protein
MRVSAALFLLPLAVLAQTPSPAPPPEVDQALRARVSEFFQYHVEGKFSKAYEMVADDTKEYYFATQKVQFVNFKIDSVKFSNDFTNAEVDLTAQRTWRPRHDFPEVAVTEQMHTTWKIENGKWMWYDHTRPTWITPFGPSDTAALQKSTTATGAAPDLSPEKMQELAKTILQPQQSPLDRAEVVLPLDKVSAEQVVFHNSQPGEVKIYLNDSSKIAGFSAEADKTAVGPGQDAVIKIHFDPKNAPESPAGFTLRVVMQPFGREFPIAIKFAPKQPAH